MQRFNPGDAVTICKLQETSTGAYVMSGDGYFLDTTLYNLLKNKVGLIYRPDPFDIRYVYIFYPELPGSGLLSFSDPMTKLCYGMYEYLLIPWNGSDIK